MHTLIPYAAPSGPQCQQALRSLQLPSLAALLPLLRTISETPGAEDDLSPLHERMHARALGWPEVDGLLPWAALEAQQAGLPAGDSGWAWITPCHWQINADHVAMEHPDHLALSAGESEALRAAMQPYFAEDGITLHPVHDPLLPRRWLAQGDILRGLPTASLARACGAKVDAWMPRAAQARSLRRLQNEMQMLLYRHPVNDARAAQRRRSVNSFWISGTGSLPAPNPAAAAPLHATSDSPMDSSLQLHLHTSLLTPLQAAALRDDAIAWTQAWQALDDGPVAGLVVRARAGQPLTLTLCGDRIATTFALDTTSWWRRLQRRWTCPTPATLLATL